MGPTTFYLSACVLKVKFGLSLSFLRSHFIPATLYFKRPLSQLENSRYLSSAAWRRRGDERGGRGREEKKVEEEEYEVGRGRIKGRKRGGGGGVTLRWKCGIEAYLWRIEVSKVSQFALLWGLIKMSVIAFSRRKEGSRNAWRTYTFQTN